MFGERLEEAKPIEGLVIFDLPSLPNCDCTDVTAYPEEGSSSKRKVSSQSIPLITPEYLCPWTAKRLALSQPSLVDRLISWNKSSLTMEGRRSIKKNQSPAKIAGEASGSSALVPAKRRRAKSLTSTVPAVKRLRNSKGGSESDTSPSACELAEKKVRNAEKVPKERSQNSDKNDQKVTKAFVSDKRQASGKLPENKTDKVLIPKKILKKGESRFSKRIRFSTSSLRSGKKRQELNDSKKLSKTPTKDLKDKRKPSTSEKTDSNYNVCTENENESENEAGENSTDSEVSRYQSDCTDDKDKNQEVEENITKKRKRRKRDSMWVKKVKKQLKGKPETEKSVVPPTLRPEGIREPVAADEQSDEKEEKDLPILDRSDDSINISNNTTFSDSLPDDVAMPKLEVQTFTAILKDGQKEPSISSINLLSKPEEKHAGQPALCVETQNTETQFEPQSEPVPLIEHAKCDEIEEDKKIPEMSSYETDISKLTDQGDKDELSNDKLFKESQPSVVDLASLNPAECETNKQLESLKSTMGEGAQAGEEKSKEVLDVPHDRERPSITEILKTECINAMQQAFASSLKDVSETIEDKEEKAIEVNVEKLETQADLAKDNEVVTRLNDIDVELPQQGVPKESSKAVTEDTFLGTAAKSDDKNNETVEGPEEQNIICGKSQELKIGQTPNQSETATHLSVKVPEENQEPISTTVSINQEIQNAVEGTLPPSKSVTYNTSEEVLNGPPSSCTLPLSFNNMESFTTSKESISIIQNNVDLSEVHTNGCTSENTPYNLFEKERESLFSNKNSGSLPCTTQCLDSESSKMDTVSYCEPVVCDTNPNSETKTPEAQNSARETELLSNEPSVSVPELNDTSGILDPDSTSDVKPQALDDSFTSLSLTFPEDLDLEEERTQSERDEKNVLPDSTLSEKSGAEINYKDESGGKKDSLCMVSKEICVKQEVKSPEPVRVEETTELSAIPEKSDEASLEELKITENIQSIRTSLEELQSKEKEGLQISPDVKAETLTLEERQRKESVLQALGLKSLSTTYRAPEEKPKRDGYTGTLKAVIKLNRTGDKKKMVYQRSEDAKGELEYRICSEILSADTVPITHLNDINGMPKIIAKHNQESDVKIGSASSNGLTDDNDLNAEDAKAGEKDLVIPEKSASFSIHPGRLCSDVCTYCFGKFGSLDTPCHVAQLKAERQRKILESEPHLTAESCLCDACYRYVDRRANCPSGGAPRQRVKPPAMSTCCVRDCSESATHTVKKKWLVKLKKSITNKLDIDLDRPGAMYYPLCAQHHYWVEYFTVCGICRKRLNRNHLYSLGSETDRLNLMLAEDGIPARLSDKLFLCKLCRYYSNLRLKYPDPSSIPTSGQAFYRDYRRKILTSFDIPVSDSEDETVVKEEKKKAGVEKKVESSSSASTASAAGCSASKSDESVMALSNLATLLGDQPEQQTRIQVKFGNVNIGRLSNLNIGQGGREERTPYPDIALQANLDFKGPEEPTGSWERCVSTIQFDKRTKKLWQDLQKPYGNQSSFLRHLVMLEKYWRSGQLTLTPSADEKVVKYLNGVRNRIKAFEGNSNTVANTERPPVTVTPVPATSVPLPTPFSSPAVTISNVPASNPVKFPPLPNTGEVEVTPITSIKRQSLPGSLLGEKKPLTLLDRAKSLVRMVPPTPPRQRFPVNVQRYPVPMFNHPSYSYAQQQQQQHLQLQQQQHLQYQQHQQQLQLKPPAPGLIKIRNKPPPPYYQQIMAAQAAAPRPLTSTVTVRPVVAPKLPKALTVTQVPPGRAAITLNRSGITIEKEVGNVITPTIPNEKPSISVFREPAPGPS